jgi:hypothetical protein
MEVGKPRRATDASDSDAVRREYMTKPQHLRYDLCRLFALVLFVAVLATGVRSCRWMEGYGDLLFWLVLLAPLGGPLLFGGSPLRSRLAWSTVHLAPISWYLCFGRLDWFDRLDSTGLLTRAVLLIGTAVACVVLVIGYRGWWHALTIPLWIAIVTGTVWVVFFWPYG